MSWNGGIKMFDGLRGVPSKIGNFLDERASGLGDFIQRIQESMPGNIVSPVPRPPDKRVIFAQPEVEPTQAMRGLEQSMKVAPQQDQAGETTSQGKSGKQSNKTTIKQVSPDGTTVTITQDKPVEPTPTPTILPNFQGVQPQVQEGISNFFGANPLEGVNINDLINLGAGESSLDPSRINTNEGGSQDFGLYQINGKWQKQLLDELGVTEQDLLDPQINMQVTREIMRRRLEKGLNPFQPWVGADSLGLR
jgi:hypothetical protein